MCISKRCTQIGLKEMSGKSEDAIQNTNEYLRDLLFELREMRRPRVFFDIVPNETRSQILDVVLRNVGGSPAYNINCKFDPDLPYYEKMTLSQMSLFRDLPFLTQGAKIEFPFASFPTYIETSDKPTKITVQVEYSDSNGQL